MNHLPASLAGLCQILLKTLKFLHSFQLFVKHFDHQNPPILRKIGLKLLTFCTHGGQNSTENNLYLMTLEGILEN